MALTQQDILSTLKDMRPKLAKKYGVEIFGIVGSWARDEAQDDSDIDVVYDLEDGRTVTLIDIGGVWYDLNTALGRDVDLVDWDMVRPAYKKFMQKELVRFYG